MSDEPSNDDTSHYEGAPLEDIQDRIRLLAEALADVPDDIHAMKQGIFQINENMTLLNMAVTEQSTDLDDHERRIVNLEKAKTA